MDNDTLTHFFLPIFNPPISSPLDYHITSLQKIKIDDLMVRLKVSQKKWVKISFSF